MLQSCLLALKTCRPQQCIRLLQRTAQRNNGQVRMTQPHLHCHTPPQCELSLKAALQLVQNLRQVATPPQALAILHLLPPSARLYHAMLLEYGRKGNLRGITLLWSEALRDERLAGVCSCHIVACVMPCASQDPMLVRFTLLNTIAAFGLAKRPDLAVLAFRAALADGTWIPAHTDVANALLNALATNTDLLHDLYVAWCTLSVGSTAHAHHACSIACITE